MYIFSLLLAGTPIYAAAEPGGPAYKDIEAHWARAAIERWSAYDIVKGYPDASFQADKKISRAEFAVIINRIVKYASIGDCLYNTPKDLWYYDDANALCSVRILMAKDGGAELSKTFVTREEVAYAIYQIFRMPKGKQKVDFTDEAQISSWAKEAVDVLCSADILHGYPDGRFGPENGISRAELITMLDNAIELYIREPGEYTYSGRGGRIVFIGSQDIKLRIGSGAEAAGPVIANVYYPSFIKDPSGVEISADGNNKIVLLNAGEPEIQIDKTICQVSYGRGFC